MLCDKCGNWYNVLPTMDGSSRICYNDDSFLKNLNDN